MDELLGFAVANAGIVLSGSEGRTLQCSSAVPAGSNVLSVAFTSCIHPCDAEPDVKEVLEHLRRSHDVHAGDGLCVVLRLAYHLALGPASQWKRYTQVLPASVPSLLHIPDASLSPCRHLLYGTPLATRLPCTRDHLGRRAAGLQQACAHLGMPWLALSTLLHAHALYTSRAMLIPLPPGVSTLSGATPSHVPAMVPLLDMADHRAGATARFVLVRGREGKIGKSEVGFGGGSGTTRSVASGSASVEDHDPFACLDGLGLQGGPASGPGRDRGQDTVAYDSAGTRESSTISDPIGEGWLIGLQVGTSHRPGQSLDISYGALTNAALAVRYGFTVQGNAADVVPVKLAWVHEEHAAGAIPKLVIEGSHAWPYSSHADSEGGSGREGAPAYRCTLSCMAVPPKLLSAAYFAVFHQDVPANPSASFPLDASSLLRDAAVAAFHAACPSPAHAQQAIAWVVQQIEGMVKAIHDAQEGQTRTEDPSLLSHTNSMCSMVRDGVVDVLHATIRMVKE